MMAYSKMRSLFQGVDYRVARTRNELEKAYQLVYQEYFKQGYVGQDSCQMRFSLHNALPQTTTMLAVVDEKVVTTATIIPDSPLGIPMDKLYSDELAQLREGGKKICEVSMLACSSELFSDNISLILNAKKMFLVFFLFKHIFDYVRMKLRMDYICITVNPKHSNVYDSLFFQDLGGLKQYGDVNDAPAVAKYLDVDAVNNQCVSSGRKGLYKMFLAAPPDFDRFLDKFEFGPKDLRYFFAEKRDLFKNATTPQMDYIKECYPDYDFSGIFSQCV